MNDEAMAQAYRSYAGMHNKSLTRRQMGAVKTGAAESPRGDNAPTAPEKPEEDNMAEVK